MLTTALPRECHIHVHVGVYTMYTIVDHTKSKHSAIFAVCTRTVIKLSTMCMHHVCSAITQFDCVHAWAYNDPALELYSKVHMKDIPNTKKRKRNPRIENLDFIVIEPLVPCFQPADKCVSRYRADRQTDRQTDRYTYKLTTVTLAVHAVRTKYCIAERFRNTKTDRKKSSRFS